MKPLASVTHNNPFVMVRWNIFKNKPSTTKLFPHYRLQKYEPIKTMSYLEFLTTVGKIVLHDLRQIKKERKRQSSLETIQKYKRST